MPKTFPIELEENLHKQAKIAAIRDGMTLHEWIVRSLKEKLNGHGNSRSNKQQRSSNRQRNRSD
jgi:hypothetical protein